MKKALLELIKHRFTMSKPMLYYMKTIALQNENYSFFISSFARCRSSGVSIPTVAVSVKPHRMR